MGLRGWLQEYVGIGGEGKAMPSSPPKESGLKKMEEEKKKKKPISRETTIDEDIEGLQNMQKRMRKKVDEVIR